MILPFLILAGVSVSQALNANLETLTSAQKDKILKAHNDERNSLGKSLPALTWSDSLATKASDAAQLCRYTEELKYHPAYRTEGLSSYVYAGSSLSIDNFIEIVMDRWIGEKNQNVLNDFSCSQTDCSAYSQMVWNKTTKLGCAITRCTSDLEYEVNGSYLVCLYEPKGNTAGERPYPA